MKIRENSGHVLRIMVLALILVSGVCTTTIWADDASPGDLPNPLSKDGIAVRPGFAAEGDAIPDSATAKYKPVTNQSSHAAANLVSGIIILAGIGCVGFLRWRNHQQDKQARRWKKRHSKWRLF